MGRYYTVPVDIQVGNSRTSLTGNEILIAKIYTFDDYLDLEVINKTTGVEGTLRVNKPTDDVSS